MITSVVDGQQVSWTDRKRYLWPLGLVVPLLPLAARQGAVGGADPDPRRHVGAPRDCAGGRGHGGGGRG